MKTEIYEALLDKLVKTAEDQEFYRKVKRSRPIGKCTYCGCTMLKDGDLVFSSNVTTRCICNHKGDTE